MTRRPSWIQHTTAPRAGWGLQADGSGRGDRGHNGGTRVSLPGRTLGENTTHLLESGRSASSVCAERFVGRARHLRGVCSLGPRPASSRTHYTLGTSRWRRSWPGMKQDPSRLCVSQTPSPAQKCHASGTSKVERSLPPLRSVQATQDSAASPSEKNGCGPAASSSGTGPVVSAATALCTGPRALVKAHVSAGTCWDTISACASTAARR